MEGRRFMKTSVASVTFRQKTIYEVAELARRAGLDAIEWGGDVHVPPGDVQAARAALRCTRENGLTVSAYGSYFRGDAEEDFTPILETAKMLESPVIRVWAGRQASASCPPEQRHEITECLARAVEQAAQAGCVVATEYHANTLTDTLASTQDLLEKVLGLRTLWQPPVGLSFEENLLALHTLRDRIENLHVYHRDEKGSCRPLEEGAANWAAYFGAAPRDAIGRYATLEFVMGGGAEQFLRDAAVLHALLKEEAYANPFV